MKSLKEILRGYGLSELEVEIEISGAREQLLKYLELGDVESAYNICEECFGLEPDYIMELMQGE